MKKTTLQKTALLIATMLFISAFVVFGDGSPDSANIQITLLNQDPNPARAGDTVLLRFKVENSGGSSVQNMNVELLEDYPFTLVSGSKSQDVGTLSAYQSGDNYATLEYTVKIDRDALQGEKELRLRYSAGAGSSTTKSFSVSIANREFAQIIFIDKAKLEPGKETDLKFTITNTGSAPLQNLIFSWEEPNGAILPVYSSDTKYVKYLDTGKSIDLVYKVIADINAQPGLYQLNLNLETESVTNASSSSISTKAGIFIGGETDFDVAFSESSAGQTSLSVANTGNNPAQSVSVKIPQQENFRMGGSNSAIIGNLDKGDYTLVSFQIVQTATMNFTGGQRGQFAAQRAQLTPEEMQIMQNFQGNATRDGASVNGNGNGNTLKVEIAYTDTTGERRIVEKNVPIQFRSESAGATGGSSAAGGFSGSPQTQKSFFGSTTFWLVLIAIIVVGFVLYIRRIRKKR